MNSVILSCFFLLMIQSASGQKKPDYSVYHDKIGIIEACNSRGNFDSSITLYTALFSEYSRVMARDAYNACQIAALKNHDSFRTFFFTCAQSGIAMESLLGNPLIQTRYRDDAKGLSELHAKGFQVYLNRIDTALRNEMLQRAENEQKYKGKEKYLEICTDNFNRILELSKQGKFPGESLIGNTNTIESIIFPTLCHYPYSYIAMEQYLYDAVNNGELTRVSPVYLYGFNQTRKSILYTTDIPADTLHFKIIYNMPFGSQSTDFVEVNKQRTRKKIYSMDVHKNLRNLNTTYGLDYLLGYY